MTLSPNTQITQENVGPSGPDPVYVAALDTLRKGAPGLSDDTRKVLANTINRKVALSRPALSPPAEGASRNDYAAQETITSVDWQRVGPKLVEALEDIFGEGEEPELCNGNTNDLLAIQYWNTARTALAAAIQWRMR